MRGLHILWLIVVLFFAGYLAQRIYEGIHFRTDLMALLPREQQDPQLQRANDIVTKALSQRIIIMIGSTDRTTARDASASIINQLSQSNLLEMVTTDYSADKMRQMGVLYFPYRSGLLSNGDRRLLMEGNAQKIAARALSQVYGLIGITDSKFLFNDPFLLLPNFFTNLPIPDSRLSVDDGMLSVQDNDTHWVMIAAKIKGSPFALQTQESVAALYNKAVIFQKMKYPDLKILHTGATFFAQVGATTALNETSTLGFISLAGTIILLVLFFRSVSPLFFCILTVTIGMMTALSACLLIFGEIHVSALLFGTTLMGVAIDYSLQYCTEIFSPHPEKPPQRLKSVFSGINLGMITTVIGYFTFLLAPFPGLRQVAVFSTIGLISSWLTVILWLPRIDRMAVPPHQKIVMSYSENYLALWKTPRLAKVRRILFIALLVAGIIGTFKIHIDDDIRHLQALPKNLQQEQAQIQKLVGNLSDNDFFIVQANDEEIALREEEILSDRLYKLIKDKKLGGFQGLANYIPSIKRQRENRELIENGLYRPLLAQQIKQLNLTTKNLPVINQQADFLSVSRLRSISPPPAFFSMLSLDTGSNAIMHIVTLDGIKDAALIAEAAKDIPGVRFVSPVDDFNLLVAKYRYRAYVLLILSILLMSPILIWRYGWRSSFWVITPPVLAVALTPGILALLGQTFTFFDAMGLILVLSVGVDYAIFCAETSGMRRPVTMLAVTMAVAITILSFGLLVFSSVEAVRTFGLTMLVGISLAFFLAPIAFRISYARDNTI